jgi:subtilisin family serine protease
MKGTLAITLIGALFFSLVTVTYAEDAAYVPGEILVGLKEGTTFNSIKAINAQLGTKMSHQFNIINAYHLRLPPKVNVSDAIAFYRRQPAVAYAEPNYIFHLNATTPDDPHFYRLWGLDNTGQTGGTPDADIDAPEAWDITVGSEKIVVAVIDTGVDYNHRDLKDNIWKNPGEIPDNGIDDDDNGFIDDVYGWDFLTDDNDPMDEVDFGHGTAVAGTIGAVGNNDFDITGVCWNVKIMGLKAADIDGINTVNAIKAIEYAKMMGARVSNASWGGPRFSWALLLAIWKSPLFIAATGNFPLDRDVIPDYPSGYRLRNIISVTTTDYDDKKYKLASYGRKSVDLGAPGKDILSIIPLDRLATWTGTSFAAPHVVGVAALIMSVSELSDLEVKRCILTSVDKVPDLEGKVLTGGRLNAEKALLCAMNAAPSDEPTSRFIIDVANNVLTPYAHPAKSTSPLRSTIATSLGNAFPSPANPEVWIPYRLDAPSDVTITIHDIAGKVVRTLQLGHQPAGVYENKRLAAHWDGRNAKGEIVTSGFYFYTIKARDFTATRKLLIIR